MKARGAVAVAVTAALALPSPAATVRAKGPAFIVFEGRHQVRGVDRWDVYRVRPDGTGFRRVPGAGRISGDPGWSPAGRRIVFSSNRKNGTGVSRLELYVMRSDGTHVVRLTRNAVADQHPSWSPNGRRIAFSRGGALWVMDANGKHARRLAAATILSRPAWSPDSRRIAFEVGASRLTSAQIAIVPAGGGTPMVVTAQPRGATDPSWSPAGDKLVVSAYPLVGNQQLFTMNPDGSSLTQFTSVPGGAFGASWAFDGSAIAFTTYEAGVKTFGIGLVRADGTDEHTLVAKRGIAFAEPDW